jgi:peptide/nickel transport system permease protein
MLKYVLRRVLYSIPVLLLASVLVFALVREFGADPARIRCEHSRDPRCLERTRHGLGLDRSLPAQYVDFMGDFLTGDWGTSQRTDQSVAEAIGDALGETAQLVGWAVLVSGAAALVVGIASARRPYSARDYVLSGLAFAGIAMPTFWLGLLSIEFLGYQLQDKLGTSEPIFFSIPNPVGSGPLDYFRGIALPVFVLSVGLVAGWSRYQRSAMLDELGRDHIRTARAKGLSMRRVVWKHGLRNSSSALVTVMAVDLGALFGGVIVTERVFSRPGMGTLLLSALTNGDTQVILPWMLVVGAIVIFFNLIADIAYGILDPRVRVA